MWSWSSTSGTDLIQFHFCKINSSRRVGSLLQWLWVRRPAPASLGLNPDSAPPRGSKPRSPLNVPAPWFSHFLMGIVWHIRKLFWELHQATYLKFLELCLTHRKHSVNTSVVTLRVWAWIIWHRPPCTTPLFRKDINNYVLLCQMRKVFLICYLSKGLLSYSSKLSLVYRWSIWMSEWHTNR